MLKENYNLVEEDLNKLDKNYTRYDIVNMIELSYIFTKIGKNLPVEIMDSAFDGINTWGLFIKFCYDKLWASKQEDIFAFSEQDFAECLKEFQEKYYKEEK